MAVDAAGLAAALGIAVADAEDAEDAGIVEATRLLSLAGSLVDSYLRGGTAPEAVRDEAVIRTAGHAKMGRAAFGIVTGRMEAGAVTINVQPRSVSPVRQSGAAALLAPYVRRTA
ncbi:MAG: hypothetical protein OXH75_18880 [Acidobacteria bacterium]|nr:hypothetical protein [Acidobacteriota bacterium]